MEITKDKALEMSLELIEQLNMDGWVLADFEPQMYACIAAIKEALSQSVKKQGSCAECGIGDGYALYCVECSEKYVKRTWVGLTDEEIEQGHKDSWVTKQAFESACWWAEKILKEKNVPRKTR
jgi:hypothetical protein